MGDATTHAKGEWVDHDWLARSMARAAGVDLESATETGAMSRTGWNTVVERCRGCGWQREGGGCTRWLAAQSPGRAEVPTSCVNQDVFAELPRIAAE